MKKVTIRKLAAIVVADIVGYSALMAKDEEAVLAEIRALQSKLIFPLLKEYEGRVFKEVGDGLLIEFASVVMAAECMSKFQAAILDRYRAQPEGLHLQYRVGIHLGDVIVDGVDLYGDGVNIAARIEPLAEANGICISDDAYRQLSGKTASKWRDGDKQSLKNIPEPMRVWHWRRTTEITEIKNTISPKPTKPVIAVLPFENLSGEAAQDYFSEGVAEDILSGLSCNRWLDVISRGSSFRFNASSFDLDVIRQKLGVTYLLTGSLRTSGPHIRVSAQLVDAHSGKHIWSSRYDRELHDIFELQDELTEAIAASINAEMALNERIVARNKQKADLTAWDLFQRGMWHLYQLNKDGAKKARGYFEQSIERDPDYANAWAALAYVEDVQAALGMVENPLPGLELGIERAEKAIALDDRDSFHFYVLGRLATTYGDENRAIPSLETCLELNPNFAQGYYGLGVACFWFGYAERVSSLVLKAIHLSPHDPLLWAFYLGLCNAGIQTQAYERAIIYGNKAVRAKKDSFWPNLMLACAHHLNGEMDAAQKALAEAHKIAPRLSINFLNNILKALHPPYKELLFRTYREIGVPE
ncbi:adenylate/guanylate cyclase domain-containing protein [Sneathiella glossodoripedis]|uniref:adenylate/guanylate cyclase domain-containing protein n=1 Tax=Sneathiella glossodoripedis TaxID=418853 RepID=UPI000471F882|nr:adenylate/guanylate cyclase domain-containing protein [Sneathiella glossodoripedis]